MKRIGTFAAFVAALALLVSAGVTFGGQRQGGASPESLVGKPAPDFTLASFEGQEVKLSDQKGKVVLIDFWATWCPPCRESLPHVQKLSDDKAMADKGLVVWAVNAREAKDKIEPFMKQNKYSFSVPMDKDGKAMTAYHVSGIPTTIVVGRDGTVKNAFVGFAGDKDAKEIHNAVAKALAEEQPAA